MTKTTAGISVKCCIIVMTLFAIGCCVGNQSNNAELLQDSDPSEGDRNVNENEEGMANDEDDDVADDIDNNPKRIMQFEADTPDENFGSESNKSEIPDEEVHEHNQMLKEEAGESSGTVKQATSALAGVMKNNGKALNDKLNQIELLKNDIKSHNIDQKMKAIDPEIKKHVLETAFNLPANKWGDMEQGEMLHQLESYYQIKSAGTEDDMVKKQKMADKPNLVDDPKSIGGDALDRTVNKAKDLKKQIQDEEEEDMSFQPPAVKKIKEDAENALQIEEAKDSEKSTDELVEKIQNTKENVMKDDHLEELFDQNHDTDEGLSLEDKESQASSAVNSAAAAITEIVPEYKYALSQGQGSPEEHEHALQTRDGQVKTSQQKEKAAAMQKAVESIPIFDSYGKANVDDINMDGIRSLTNVDEDDEFEDIEVLGDENDEINIGGGGGNIGLGNVQETVRRHKRNIKSAHYA